MPLRWENLSHYLHVQTVTRISDAELSKRRISAINAVAKLRDWNYYHTTMAVIKEKQQQNRALRSEAAKLLFSQPHQDN